MELFDIFDRINLPAEDAPYHLAAAPLSDHAHHRLAKDRDGNPILLLASGHTGDAWHAPTINLQYVTVTFNIKCAVRYNDQDFVRVFTTVAFHGRDEALKRYFLQLCDTLLRTLGEDPTPRQIRQEISFFVELLQLASAPPLKAIQGLWAELLIIAQAKTIEPFIACWHNLPEEKYDFNTGAERLEVKSSSFELRVHAFALEQLQSPPDTKSLVASVLMRQSAGGLTIDDLVARIAERVQFNPPLLQKIRTQVALTLGRSILEATQLTFDYQFAVQSLRFYRSEDIPQIPIAHIPPLVTDVKFNADISLVTPLTSKERAQYLLLS